MKSSTLARAALAAGLSVLALASTALPASAAVTSISFIPSTQGGPAATLVEYSLDTSSPRADDPCHRAPSSYYNQRVTLTVPVSGSYRFSDANQAGNIPAQYSPQTTQRAVGNGYAGVTDGVTCLADIDSNEAVTLQAGVSYDVNLHTSSTNAVGAFAFLISGPAPVTVDGLAPEPTPEQALAACADGAPVPFGYTLLAGTAKGETLTGTAGKDLVRGLGGNDTIRGLGGDDILCGGEGIDTIDGGAGNDFVFGEGSQDVLSGGIGDDHLDGGLGNDTINGGDGADTLLGGDGQDTLYGQAGDDELFGGAGQDVLDGGVGTDEGTDTDPRSVFRNIETVNGPPAPGPQPTSTATR